MDEFEASYSAEIIVSSLENCLQLISCTMHDVTHTYTTRSVNCALYDEI
jgi:hypothetical protein